MKFTPDHSNPKKVAIVPETDAEKAWFATLREGGKRVKRGAERYVLAAFADWQRGGHKVAAAKAEAQAKRDDTRQAEGRKVLAEVREWAERLNADLDYREGLARKDEVGPLTSLACRAAQLLGVANPDLAGVPWTQKAEEILGWWERVA